MTVPKSVSGESARGSVRWANLLSKVAAGPEWISAEYPTWNQLQIGKAVYCTLDNDIGVSNLSPVSAHLKHVAIIEFRIS